MLHSALLCGLTALALALDSSLAHGCAKLDEPKTPGRKLRPRFHFRFGDELDYVQYSWYVLGDLFENVNCGDEFRGRLRKIQLIAESDPTAATDLKERLQSPGPLKLTFDPESAKLSMQLDILTNITNTLGLILTIEKQ